MALPALLLLAPPARAAATFEGHDYYLGELHAHTGASGDGAGLDIGNPCPAGLACGSLAGLADDVRGRSLDFFALTDHINAADTMSEEDFDRVREAVLGAHDPEGGLVAILGAEAMLFRAPGDSLGHKTILLFGEDDALRALRLQDLQPLGDAGTDLACDDIWTWAERLDALAGPLLLVPHHPALEFPEPTDWTCHDPRWQPVGEVASRHGNSRAVEVDYDPPWTGPIATGTIENALAVEGLVIGVVGGTDSHDTRPGEVCDLDSSLIGPPYGGALTVVVLPEGAPFDRMAIHDALVERRTYATSGPLVPVRFEARSGGALLGEMGTVAAVPPGQELELVVKLPPESFPEVVDAFLQGPEGRLDLAPDAPTSAWRATIPADAWPAWVMPIVVLAGEGVHPEGCVDGGTDDTERLWLSPTWFVAGEPDVDDDGTSFPDGDCDDGDPSVHPGAAEICAGGVDEDCNGLADGLDPACGSVGGCGCGGTGPAAGGLGLLLAAGAAARRRRHDGRHPPG